MADESESHGALVEVFAGTQIEAEVFRALLEEEGIPTAVHGETNALGAGFVSFLPIRLLVPEQDAARAMELLAALERSEGEIADEDAPEELRTTEGAAGATTAPPRADPPPDVDLGPYRRPSPPETSTETERPPHRLRRVAGFASIFPGGGNLYARHSVTGAMLFACFLLTALWVLPLGVNVYFVWSLVFFADLVTSQVAVSRCNAGRIASGSAQFAIAIASWVVVDSIVWIVVEATAAYAP